ncbi:hypothetical protein V500_04592, partial [Pseudogymnoascus sp. VKM F-4518 (FW-2643)]
MGSECHMRDCYDLCYSRSIGVLWAGVEESQDEKEAREKENARTTSLSEISKTLRGALRKNDALVSGINLGTHRLLQAADDTASPAPQKRTLASGPSRTDTDDEDAVIRSRLVSASYLTEVLVDSLKQINKAILQTNSYSARPSQEPTVQGPTVFYRVSHETSYTPYDVDLGLWSARGLPDHDFQKPSEYEFRAHLDGEKNFTKPYAERERFKSPYISLTTDPGFACKYGRYDGLFVYEIDAAKLRQMKVHIESTFDIATGWGIRFKGLDKGRQHYVTESHWLARFWIPAECRKTHSFTAFREKCIKAGFVDGRTYEAIETALVPADAHEKLATLLRDDEGVPQEFADEYDKHEDQPSPVSHIMASAGPSRRVRYRRKLTDGNDDKLGEIPPPVQNPASADSEQPSPASPLKAEVGLAPRSKVRRRKSVIPKPKSADDHDEPEDQPSPASPLKADVDPPRSLARRVVRRRKLTNVNDNKVTETPSLVQNPPSAESELEQGFQALELSDG